MSGLAQFVAARGLGTLQEWCEEGYNAVSNIDHELSGEGVQGGGGGTEKSPEVTLILHRRCALVRDVHPLNLGGMPVNYLHKRH